jgi:hypothetical protein
MPVVMAGRVLAPDGAPAEGVVVVSSAGGKAVTDRNGAYQLEVEVPLEAESVQVTAAGAGDQNLTASTRVGITARELGVDPLRLTPGNTCEPSWLPTFGGMPGSNNEVHALTVYDDGSGPALYAGGGFTIAGGADASGIAKWDGTRWTALGSGVSSLLSIETLAVYDDGSGPALYAGGSFTSAGGGPADFIAKWDGVSWSPLGGGMNAPVYALTVHDDGGGPALYAGGSFTSAGGMAAKRVGRWGGASWAALGSGMSSATIVYALAVYDDGSGPALYAGGTSGDWTPSTNRIAKWDGPGWTALGAGWVVASGCRRQLPDGVRRRPRTGALRRRFLHERGWCVREPDREVDGLSWSALGSGVDFGAASRQSSP